MKISNEKGYYIDKEKYSILNIEAGKYIRKMRLKKGLTGSELAELIGVSQQQISRYERGKNSLSLADYAFILSVLDVSFLDFFVFLSFNNI